MPPAGFEPTIPASERPQTHTLYRAVWRELNNFAFGINITKYYIGFGVSALF